MKQPKDIQCLMDHTVSTIRVNLSCIPIEALLLTKDYCESEYGEKISISYSGGEAEIILPDEDSKLRFTEELNDFVKRLSIAKRTRAVKEIIIGRALYGIVERCE